MESSVSVCFVCGLSLFRIIFEYFKIFATEYGIEASRVSRKSNSNRILIIRHFEVQIVKMSMLRTPWFEHALNLRLTRANLSEAPSDIIQRHWTFPLSNANFDQLITDIEGLMLTKTPLVQLD